MVADRAKLCTERYTHTYTKIKYWEAMGGFSIGTISTDFLPRGAHSSHNVLKQSVDLNVIAWKAVSLPVASAAIVCGLFLLLTYMQYVHLKRPLRLYSATIQLKIAQISHQVVG